MLIQVLAVDTQRNGPQTCPVALMSRFAHGQFGCVSKHTHTLRKPKTAHLISTGRGLKIDDCGKLTHRVNLIKPLQHTPTLYGWGSFCTKFRTCREHQNIFALLANTSIMASLLQRRHSLPSLSPTIRSHQLWTPEYLSRITISNPQ